ncbi:MAG: PCRF domain-containing protein [Patescibacteria group bacterium]
MEEIEAAFGKPDFWESAKGGGRAAADEKIKRIGEIKDVLERYDVIEKNLAILEKEFNEELFFETKRKFRELELRELFKGQYDKQSAVVGIYPGAGGEDAEDWARILFDMYLKYAERRGWKTAVLDHSANRRSIEIKGEYAYGYLKKEAGVHRLVRISPFSAKQLRHTSFALVEVLPDIPEVDESKIQIPDEDLKWEFTRSSGPGGQNVNKVETAVRVTHLPTGITVGSQAERSQKSNREKALKVLKAKLIHIMEERQVKELKELRVNVKPEWGNQIRSYVMNPYQMAKDHRTNVETARIDDVLNGELDIFIEAEIESMRE